MRVIAGRFRRRTLASLTGQDTRPTYDRLKETLFNVLASAGNLEGANFLDLFAGTGSVGIEALSRGAAHIVFVENSRAAAGVITANLKSLSIGEEAEALECDAAEALRRLAARGDRFGVCFLDPPYRMTGAYEQMLRLLGKGTLLKEEGWVIAEHEKRFDPGDGTQKLVRFRRLEQGDSALSFYKTRK